MNNVMPDIWASLGCRRVITAVALILRVSSGFRLIRMRPLLSVVLVPSTPMKDDRLSTAVLQDHLRELLLLARHFSERYGLRGLGNSLDHSRVLNGKEAFRNLVEQQDGH